MRFELGYLERAYVANMYRARSQRLRKLVDERSASATTQESEREAAWCDAQAQALDDGVDAISEKEPSRVTATRDIDAVDAPTRNGAHA